MILLLDQEIKDQSTLKKQDDLIPSVSLENATYFENNLNHDQNQEDKNEELEEVVIDDISLYEERPLDTQGKISTQDEVFPQLFSDEGAIDTSSEDNIDEISKNEDEDFEIPAFLRKHKF